MMIMMVGYSDVADGVVRMTLDWKEGLKEEKNVRGSAKFRSDSTVRSRRHLRVS